jgi:hypothetical protein
MCKYLVFYKVLTIPPLKKAATAARVLRRIFFVAGHNAGSKGFVGYIFGYCDIDPKFRQKNSLSGHVDFFQIYTKKWF